MEIHEEKVINLITICQEETAKFRTRKSNDERYCYELFRRAFENNDDEALAAVYQMYLRLIYFWVEKHTYFSTLNLPIEYFVADSTSEFMLAMRGRKLDEFPSVAALLAYWRQCVHSVISAEYRKQRPKNSDLDPNAHAYTPKFNKNLDRAMLWTRIAMILESTEDLLLARLYFAQALKPRQIAELHPDNWPTARKVTVALQRIARQLSNDDDLRQLL